MTDPAPSIDLTTPRRVLAIGAHPDDVEFGCGATLAKWSAAGAEVHLLVLTDGSKGTWDPNTDPAELVVRREDEQRAAAAIMGVTRIHLLGIVDGELENSRTTRRHVCTVIRNVAPEVVLGHDPWKRYRLHPDHRNAGELTIEAIVAARDPHFFPDAGDPHRPSALLLFEPEVVDHLEDAGNHLGAKIAALLAHRSQWRSTMGIDPDGPDAEAQRHRFEAQVTREAVEAGAPAGLALGEAFKLIRPL